MMNKLLFCINILFTMCPFAIGQKNVSFEGILIGKIIYTNKYDSTDNPYGDSVKILLKDGHLKRIYNSFTDYGIREEIYSPDDGHLYMKIGSNDTIFWFDAKTNPRLEIVKTSVNEAVTTILNQKCDLVEVQSKYTNGDFEMIMQENYFFQTIYQSIRNNLRIGSLVILVTFLVL